MTLGRVRKHGIMKFLRCDHLMFDIINPSDVRTSGCNMVKKFVDCVTIRDYDN